MLLQAHFWGGVLYGPPWAESTAFDPADVQFLCTHIWYNNFMWSNLGGSLHEARPPGLPVYMPESLIRWYMVTFCALTTCETKCWHYSETNSKGRLNHNDLKIAGYTRTMPAIGSNGDVDQTPLQLQNLPVLGTSAYEEESLFSPQWDEASNLCCFRLPPAPCENLQRVGFGNSNRIVRR